jgi:hypothetical protein
MTNALTRVNALTGYNFQWKDSYLKRLGGHDGQYVKRHDVGVIAQELKEVLPEAVCEREDGYLAVRYEKIVPLLIEAIKELTIKVNSLEAQ